MRISHPHHPLVENPHLMPRAELFEGQLALLRD